MRVKTRKKIRLMSFLLIILYGIIIIYFTLFSDRLGRIDGYSEYHYNLIPFYEIHRFIRYRHMVSVGAFLLNICGNLMVFAPLGFLIPLWNPKGSRWYHIVVYSFSFSLCIELLQLFCRVGVFDVDDLIMNTIGGFIGFITYRLSCAVFRIGRRKKRS